MLWITLFFSVRSRRSRCTVPGFNNGEKSAGRALRGVQKGASENSSSVVNTTVAEAF